MPAGTPYHARRCLSWCPASAGRRPPRSGIQENRQVERDAEAREAEHCRDRFEALRQLLTVPTERVEHGRIDRAAEREHPYHRQSEHREGDVFTLRSYVQMM